MIYTPQKFSMDAGISLKLAKRILDFLYDKELNAQDLNSVIWRLRDWVMKTEDMAKLLEKQDDATLENVIDEMIAERNQYMCPKNVCCAETADELEQAFNALGRPEAAWLFSTLQFKEKDKDFKEGDVVTIQILRTGTWKHAMYGDVVIDKKVIEDVVQNFKDRKRGIDLAVDENHEENHKALGWFKELYSEDDGESCFAKIELTKKGADLLNEGAYKYFSPEIVFMKEDEETGEEQRNLLIGGAFTNRPFFKAMQPLMASENATNGASAKDPIAGQFLFVSLPDRMKKFLELLAKLKTASTVSASEIEQLRQAYSEVPSDNHNQGFDEEVASVEKKAEGDGETPEQKEAREKAEAAAAGGEGGGEGEGGAAAAADTVQATENGDGTVTLAATEWEQIKRDRAAKKFSEVLTSLAPFRFSETNKKGFILPKDAQSFAEFVCSMSEADQKKLLGFMKQFKSLGSEQGSNGNSNKTVDGSVALTEDDDMVKRYMSEFGQSKEMAIQSAKTFYELQAKRSSK